MITRGRHGTRDRRAGSWRVCTVGLLLAVVCGGCHEDVVAPPPLPDFGYLPDNSPVALTCGDHLDFRVLKRDVDIGTVTWRTASGQTGHGERFRYFAEQWSPDTLFAEVTAGDLRRERRWILDMVAGLTATGFLPPEETVALAWGFERAFGVAVRCEPFEVFWHLDGDSVETGPSFAYTPRLAGQQTLTATVSLPDTNIVHRWQLQVGAPGELMQYSPVATSLEIYETTAQYFSVQSDAVLLFVTWSVDGTQMANGQDFVYAAEQAGSHRVEVAIELPGTTVVHGWDVVVLTAESGRPPPVTDLVAMPGPLLGQTTLTWSEAGSGAFPLVAYELRYGYWGPLTAADWPLALPVDAGVWTAGEGNYQVTIWSEDLGWFDGLEICCAVRARDDRDILSDLGGNACLLIEDDWWIEGLVTGPDGTPAAAAQVGDLLSGVSVATAADGSYRIGPFEPRDEVQLAVTGTDAVTGLPWSPVSPEPMTYRDPQRRDFRMIPAYGADPSCAEYTGNFILYLRLMTRTLRPPLGTSDYSLMKWATYPVDVYVPAQVSPAGLDFGVAGRRAVRIWNDSMGSVYLRLVDTPPAVGILFTFAVDDGVSYGRADLLQPGDGQYSLSEVSPELVEVSVNPIIDDAQTVTEIALHELGHCLGLYDHTVCARTPYLMRFTPFGALDAGEENAIHPDERHAVHIIRQLPQGWDMSIYPPN